MKQWQETAEIYDRIAALGDRGDRCALATVVRIRGSAYRRAGAKFLIEASGATTGGVSGGCLEADVCEIGRAMLPAGRPTLRRYDTGSDEDQIWGLGLGCNGEVEVFVQPVGAAAARPTVDAVRALLAGDAPFTAWTVLEGSDATVAATVVTADGRIVAGTTGDAALDGDIVAHGAAATPDESDTVELRGARLFADVLLPPPRLAVFGAGDDAVPLAALASTVGFRVTVVDHRPAFLEASRFAPAVAQAPARSDEGLPDLPWSRDTLAVVMTHSLRHDTAWAGHLLRTDVPYVGMLGPRSRTDDILEEIGAAGSERVFGPVGLDLGADGPEQVAVSVVSELLAFRARRTPTHLRDRRGAIHVG